MKKAVPLLILGCLSLNSCSVASLTGLLFDLKVTVQGVPSAEITIQNLKSKKQEFKGFVDGSKILTNLPSGQHYLIQGHNLPGYQVSQHEKITLFGNTHVVLIYQKID